MVLVVQSNESLGPSFGGQMSGVEWPANQVTLYQWRMDGFGLVYMFIKARLIFLPESKKRFVASVVLVIHDGLIPEMSNHRIFKAEIALSAHHTGGAARRFIPWCGDKHHACLN